LGEITDKLRIDAVVLHDQLHQIVSGIVNRPHVPLAFKIIGLQD
jgi:hypothetical protein